LIFGKILIKRIGDNMGDFNKRMFYVFIGCICLALTIVGATYAYFTANAVDANTVQGNSATVTFGLSVNRVTTIDMAYGLIPMKSSQAPNAAKQKCLDSFGNAGCQIYKITINADSDTVMFLDGYIVVTPRDERLETRFTEIYTVDNGENFNTIFTNESMALETFEESRYIKTGVRGSDPETYLNHTEDYQCLFIENRKIGGDIGRTQEFYVMIWVHDNGEAQDYLQGMQLAYRGEVTFVTAEGNEISATFD
jgi:predicted ribosomally synthesized peptide with SipW-like signal peptide